MQVVKLIFILTSLLSLNGISLSLAAPVPPAEFTSLEAPVAYQSKVRIYNRTDWNVQIFIDGYHAGEVWGDHNAYFNVYPGTHRVVIKWPSGHTEWFDFVVARGNVHKIWTSDYDG